MLTAKTKVLTSGTRLASMFFDHIIMTGVAMLFFIPALVINLPKLFVVTHEPSDINFLSSPLFYIGLLGFALYFCKDSINGRSPGKRINKLQVVDSETMQAASPLQCFVRNIFCIIWPIEAIAILANPARRIGDIAAGTEVVFYDPATQKTPVNIPQTAGAILLSYGILVGITLSIGTINPSSKDLPYLKSSYNIAKTKALEKLLTDSVGQYMVPSVRVYDSCIARDGEYISIIGQFKQNYFIQDSMAYKLEELTINQIYTLFPKNTFSGRSQYYYSDGSSMQEAESNFY